MRPVAYILWRVSSGLVSLRSRAFNAVVLGGSTAQTTSAREHLEAPYDKKFACIRRVINAIFFLQEDHCKHAWELEVDRARYVLPKLNADLVHTSGE
jgi:hypothetical protein